MNWMLQENVIVQGITQPGVSQYVAQMKAYGTKILAGVATGEKEETIEDIPLFNLVEDAIAQFGEIKISLIFVPPNVVLDAAREAIAAGIEYLIILSQGVPPLDIIYLLREIGNNVLVLGSGSHGIIIPDKVCLGNLQPIYFKPGAIGLISCSEFLSYEIGLKLNKQGIGESIVIDLGNDDILGSNLSQWLTFLDEDENTTAIVFIQQVKYLEKFMPDLLKTKVKKPIVTYIAGLNTPQFVIAQDATSIVTNYLSTTVSQKTPHRKIIDKLKKAGIVVAENPEQIFSTIN